MKGGRKRKEKGRKRFRGPRFGDRRRARHLGGAERAATKDSSMSYSESKNNRRGLERWGETFRGLRGGSRSTEDLSKGGRGESSLSSNG